MSKRGSSLQQVAGTLGSQRRQRAPWVCRVLHKFARVVEGFADHPQQYSLRLTKFLRTEGPCNAGRNSIAPSKRSRPLSEVSDGHTAMDARNGLSATRTSRQATG